MIVVAKEVRGFLFGDNFFKKVDMDFLPKSLTLFEKNVKANDRKERERFLLLPFLEIFWKVFEKSGYGFLKSLPLKRFAYTMIELVWIFLTVWKVLMWNSVGATIIAFSYHSEM